MLTASNAHSLQCYHARQVLLLSDKDHFATILSDCSKSGKLLVVDYYTTWEGRGGTMQLSNTAPRLMPDVTYCHGTVCMYSMYVCM